MQSFIVGLMLAGVSAISFVAFKHPHGYARLFPFLIGGVTAVFLGITVWHIAIEALWGDLSLFVDESRLREAHEAKAQFSLPFAWSAIAYIGVTVFLWVNLKLPPFLENTDEGNSSPGEGR